MSQIPIEIHIGDVTDMEARVLARYTGAEHVALSGTIRGPFCESARTLPATFAFQPSGDQEGAAEAIVTDPCLWSAKLPHLYRVDIDARCGEYVVASYHGAIGLSGPGRRILC